MNSALHTFWQALGRLLRQQPAHSVQQGETDADPDQAYYETPEWQAAEREADEDIKAGRTERYNSKEAFRDSFKVRE